MCMKFKGGQHFHFIKRWDFDSLAFIRYMFSSSCAQCIFRSFIHSFSLFNVFFLYIRLVIRWCIDDGSFLDRKILMTMMITLAPVSHSHSSFHSSKMVKHTYEMLMLWGTVERRGKKWTRQTAGDGKNSKIHAVNASILYE